MHVAMEPDWVLKDHFHVSGRDDKQISHGQNMRFPNHVDKSASPLNVGVSLVSPMSYQNYPAWSYSNESVGKHMPVLKRGLSQTGVRNQWGTSRIQRPVPKYVGDLRSQATRMERLGAASTNEIPEGLQERARFTR